MTEIMTSYNKCGGVKSRASVRKKIIELGLAEKTELKRKRRNVSKGCKVIRIVLSSNLIDLISIFRKE